MAQRPRAGASEGPCEPSQTFLLEIEDGRGESISGFVRRAGTEERIGFMGWLGFITAINVLRERPVA